MSRLKARLNKLRRPYVPPQTEQPPISRRELTDLRDECRECESDWMYQKHRAYRHYGYVADRLDAILEGVEYETR